MQLQLESFAYLHKSTDAIAKQLTATEKKKEEENEEEELSHATRRV